MSATHILILFFLVVGILIYQDQRLFLDNQLDKNITNVKVIRLVVEQSYEKAKFVNLPFFEVTKEIFEKYGGFQVVEKDGDTFDATVYIKAKGTPFSAEYFYFSSLYTFYTGAAIEGEILFFVKNKTFKWPFSGKKDPPVSISVKGFKRFVSPYEYTTPDDAPFSDVFNDVFYLCIMKILLDLKGIDSLILALEDENWMVRKAAIEVLGKIKNSLVVEVLIFMLSDTEQEVRHAALKTLKEITGKDFGYEQERWIEWWGKNKDMY